MLKKHIVHINVTHVLHVTFDILLGNVYVFSILILFGLLYAYVKKIKKTEKNKERDRVQRIMFVSNSEISFCSKNNLISCSLMKIKLYLAY